VGSRDGRARGLAALAFVFFANGAALASWYPHIPFVQTRLGIGTGPLGLALLGMAGGALGAMPLAGALLSRTGTRPLVALTLVGVCLGLPLPVLAGSTWTLALALVFFGACNGALDVSMNAHAVALEREAGGHLLSRLHALFPLGGLLGAGASAIALHAGVSPLGHLLVCAAGLGTASVVAIRALEAVPVAATENPAHLGGPVRPVLTLGLIGFCGLLAEGAMGDWTAIWLHRSLGTSEALAACGFAVFSVAMAAGRLVGDRLVARQGTRPQLQKGGLLAASSLAIALLVGHPLIALAGCAGVGLGLANVIPIVFREASVVPGLAPGQGLAAATTVGYCGLLAGPPLIGLVADVTGLPRALGLVVLAAAVVALLAALLPPTSRTPAQCPPAARPNVVPKKLPGFQRGGSGSEAIA
jgi:predicted MFS family arabinose efflux permease